MSNKDEGRWRARGANATISQVGELLGHRPNCERTVLESATIQQLEKGYISHDDIDANSAESRIAASESLGTTSFYALLNLHRPGDEAMKREMIRVCDGPSCCLNGCDRIRERLDSIAAENDEFAVGRVSCIGQCASAPALLANQESIAPIDIEAITSESLDSLKAAQHHAAVPLLSADKQALSKPLSERIPGNDQRAPDYLSLRRALTMSPFEVIQEVEESGLRGRGGAGFNTGQKWKMVREGNQQSRYVVCNADESEPGTFKDRFLLEGDPHLLIEAMMICGYAVNAQRGIIYIRGEYAEAARILEFAVKQARNARLLGEQSQSDNFTFDIEIHSGAGAYICGEETALLESLEGKRGEPRARPPFPTTAGYLGCPTVVNNVETLCSVPYIIANGAESYRQLGNGEACGTKLYCISGHVSRAGVCEAPFGTTTRELIESYAGGVANNRKFKLAVTGGAAGTFLSEPQLDIPLDFQAWDQGVAVGSGGIIVADDSVSAVEVLLWILQFFEVESCGKCTPCRIGTVQARQVVERILAGGGQPGDIERLTKLAKVLERTSFCGLGQSVAWPIESAIQQFRTDFTDLGAS